MKKQYKPNSTEIYIHSQVEGLPTDLVEKIFNTKQKRYKSFISRLFGQKEDVYLSEKEYLLMLQGAKIAYNNQHLLGTALPQDNPLVKDVENALNNLGVYIQYHPEHGLMIIQK